MPRLLGVSDLATYPQVKPSSPYVCGELSKTLHIRIWPVIRFAEQQFHDFPNVSIRGADQLRSDRVCGAGGE